MSAVPIWYLDTSSLISLRSQFSREDRQAILDGLSNLVAEERLRFPSEVVPELERYAGDDNPGTQLGSTTPFRHCPSLVRHRR